MDQPLSTDRRGRLLITTSTFPVSVGDGRPRFILDLAKALTTEFDVQVLTPHIPGAPRFEIVDGVDVRRFRYFFPSGAQRLASGAGMASNLRSDWMSLLLVPFFMVAQIAATARAVSRFRPDVINCHWLVPQGMSAAIVRAFKKVPVVLHVHAADVYFLQRFRWGRRVARFVIDRSAAVFADGSHVRDALDDLLGRPSGAVLRPMGVWVAEFSAPPDGKNTDRIPGRIIFVGRLVEKKGVVYLIRALKAVQHGVPHARLLVIGAGPLKQSLLAEVNRLGLADSVDFLGPLDHPNVVRHLHEAEVACVPSIIDSRGETEGMPTVVLEAMASGIRVVGSDVDGIPDVLRHRVNGWLAEPGDADALAEAILEALTSPNAAAIATDGVSTAQHHNWSEVAAEYAVILNQSASHAV